MFLPYLSSRAVQKLRKGRALPVVLPNVYKLLLREFDGKLIFCSKVFFAVVYSDTRSVRFRRRIDIQLRTNNCGDDSTTIEVKNRPSMFILTELMVSFLESANKILN